MQLLTIYNVIKQNVAIRFGIIAIGKGDKSSSSWEAAKCIELLADKTKRFSLKFVEALINVQKGDITVKDVKDACYNVAGIYTQSSNEPNIDSRFHKWQQLASRFGVLQSGGIFANGKFIALTASWTNEVLPVNQQMMKFLATKVGQGSLSDKDDIYDLFMTLPGVNSGRNFFIYEDAVYNPVKNYSGINWVYEDEMNDATVSMIICSDFSTLHGMMFALNGLKVRFM